MAVAVLTATDEGPSLRLEFLGPGHPLLLLESGFIRHTDQHQREA
jgi:hypothetical protein